MLDSTISPMQIAHKTALGGVKIFPFHHLTKKPYQGFTDWKNRATTDLERIRQWWITYPDAMIAAPTGSINGFFVLDVDAGESKVGLESLSKLEEKFGKLPATRIVKTPSGGFHFYFRMPPDRIVKNTVSAVAPNIDIRGDGGCIIWAGSVRYDGKYEIVNNWR